MSKQVGVARRMTVPAIKARKGGDPIVCLTAYTTPMAALLDPHCDILLVGDSVGMVMHGLPDTVGVTLEMMLMHGRAVMRGASAALVVVDLPFGAYEESKVAAYRSAVRVLKETGAQAVKIESCKNAGETIAYLVERGIPVMGHVGLKPQSVHMEGGMRAKGRDMEERMRVLNEAKEAADAGAFAIVVEGVTMELAREVTAAVPVPTIGIGASSACDGQILVTDDMLGLFDWTPKFVRRYADLRTTISDAAAGYAADVRSRSFPGTAETYTLGQRRLSKAVSAQADQEGASLKPAGLDDSGQSAPEKVTG
jgi:3-methyl-2-oxobutanoate hydroxymethyltransferase